jgi:hypothetical protein
MTPRHRGCYIVTFQGMEPSSSFQLVPPVRIGRMVLWEMLGFHLAR